MPLFYILMRAIISLLSLVLAVAANAALPGLTDTLANIIGKREVSVAVLTSHGDTICAGRDGMCDLASVMKFHQAAALSRVVDFDTLVNKRITVYEADLKRNTWSPMRAAATEVPFEIKPVELLDYTLNMSDNNAADILFDRFAAPAKVDSIVRHDYGISDFAIGVTEDQMHADPELSRLNRSTALDAARLIYCFFTADTTASATLVKAVMARDTPFGRERIPAGIATSSAKVFHKTGTGFTAADSTVTPVNDLALISYPTGRGYACYALAVFTGGMKPAEAEAIIAEISRAVYTAIIVNESLTMINNAPLPYAGKKSGKAPSQSDNDTHVLGEIITETIFTIVDHALQ